MWKPPKQAPLKTVICLILDRSGSMSGRESDVIGGVNSFLEDQKKLDAPASIAMVRFDSQGIERFRSMGPLQSCAKLTADDFQPRGGTPLLDAIGKTLNDLDNDWRTENPDRGILVIVTDGQENASIEFKKDQIKKMILDRQASGRWAIIYLGANVDAFGEASSMGISNMNTANYINTPKGIGAMYFAASSNVSAMRSSGNTYADSLNCTIGEGE